MADSAGSDRHAARFLALDVSLARQFPNADRSRFSGGMGTS
jgi:hypothetical protein